jgi:hypothetical protein
MQFPPAHTYRPSLAGAFLVCIAWLALLSFGLFDYLPLPSEAKVVLGLFIPLCASIAILSRTVLFREMQRTRRLFNLFGVAFALLVCAGALLLVLTVLLVGIHPA